MPLCHTYVFQLKATRLTVTIRQLFSPIYFLANFSVYSSKYFLAKLVVKSLILSRPTLGLIKQSFSICGLLVISKFEKSLNIDVNPLNIPFAKVFPIPLPALPD